VAPDCANDTWRPREPRETCTIAFHEPNLLVKIPATSQGRHRHRGHDRGGAQASSVTTDLLTHTRLHRKSSRRNLSGLGEPSPANRGDLSSVHSVAFLPSSVRVGHRGRSTTRRMEATTKRARSAAGQRSPKPNSPTGSCPQGPTAVERWSNVWRPTARGFQRPLWAFYLNQESALSRTTLYESTQLIGPDNGHLHSLKTRSERFRTTAL
jgi:hypothetical protein